MLSSKPLVPQTMLSSLVPQTMLSQPLAAHRAPHDVVAVVGGGHAPVRADRERVRGGHEHAAADQVVTPDDVLAPHVLGRIGLPGLRGGKEPREAHGADGVDEAGTLCQRVVARDRPAPCTEEWP